MCMGDIILTRFWGHGFSSRLLLLEAYFDLGSSSSKTVAGKALLRTSDAWLEL